MGVIITRTKGTVRFAFKDSVKTLELQKNKDSLIYLHFTYGTKRFKYSTGYKSCYNNWDFSKQRIKNKAAILNKDEINAHLSSIESFINTEYSKLSLKLPEVPKKALTAKLDKFLENDPEGLNNEDPLSFFQIIDKYIEERKGHISVVTERSYKQTKKRLEDFEKVNNEKLEFDTMDMSFYFKFNAFMEHKKYSLNTIGKHIKSIRTFNNYALNEGYTNSTKFKSKEFKVKKEITTEIYLSDQEIQKMYIKDLSKYPELEHARDIFLIGCYTGQRVSDYNYLTKDDIIEKDNIQYFKVKQNKNRKYSRTVFCPITKEIRYIMEKRHNGEPPKTMPESILNEKIKEVGQMVEINQLIKCEFTKGGRLESEMTPKYKLIKTHTARRSFCTNKYKAGMGVFDIMLFSGHSTEKEFYKYIRIKDEERAAHLAKSGYFNL